MDSFIVVTKTLFDSSVENDVTELSKKVFPIFQKQAGLIALRMHLDHEHKHTMTYFEWESKEAHEACMASPDFGEWNKAWEGLIASGKVKWELHTYDILNAYSA